MPSVPAVIINAIRAKHQAEVGKHLIARSAFVRHVQSDSRTRAFFARCRRASTLDLGVAVWSEHLDAAAARFGLAHRSAFLRDGVARAKISRLELEFSRQWQILRARTLDARAAEVLDFVAVLLNDRSSPIRAWLGYDILRVFDAEVLRDVWGDTETQLEVTAGTLGAAELQKGNRPKKGGEHIERDVRWYYLAEIAVPTTKRAALALEYRATREAAGVFLAPKDHKDITERAETSVVRDGIEEAKRLLELSIPPEQWPKNLKI